MGGWWGVQSHFRVEPNLVLRLGWGFDKNKIFAMIASNAFDRILNEIQASNLNFQLQVSPFSAHISLRKSLIKDRNGCYCLPSESLPPRTESEFLSLQKKNNASGKGF